MPTNPGWSGLVSGLSSFPAARSIFVLLGLSLAVYAALFPRRGMVDHVNYVQYFIDGPSLAWLADLAEVQSVLDLMAAVFSEEILWRIWTTLVGVLFGPEVSVYVTVAALNLMVIMAVRNFRNPALTLVLWVVIPVGFAVTGMYQIRQGFAFALWLMIAVRWNRPVTGTVVAALVHTTFAMIVPIVFIATRRSLPEWIRLCGIAAFSVAFASVGLLLFEQFGGRRVEIYLLSDAAFSPNFVAALLLLVPFPLWLALGRQRGFPGSNEDLMALRTNSLTYVGLLIYLVVCFFLFPLGMFRVNYLASLGLLPVLGNCDLGSIRRLRLPPLGVILGMSVALAYVAYVSAEAMLDNRYACVLVSKCELVLGR